MFAFVNSAFGWIDKEKITVNIYKAREDQRQQASGNTLEAKVRVWVSFRSEKVRTEFWKYFVNAALSLTSMQI